MTKQVRYAVILHFLLALASASVIGQTVLTINGQCVPTTCSSTPPPPPVCTGGQTLQGGVCVCVTGTWNGSYCFVNAPPVTGYATLPTQAISWPAGGSPNTVGPAAVKTQPAKTIQPYSLPVSALFGAGTKAGIQLYENSYNLKVNISATPGDMGSPGGLNPYLSATSGSDGLKFAASNDPIADSTLSAYGWKRTPAFPSGTVYINVQAEGSASYTLLYFPQ